MRIGFLWFGGGVVWVGGSGEFRVKCCGGGGGGVVLCGYVCLWGSWCWRWFLRCWRILRCWIVEGLYLGDG